MNYPDTGHRELDRCIVWYHLVVEMGKTYAERSRDVRALGDVELDMGNVIKCGVAIVKGHYCASAACAIGTAALYPYFNQQGLEPAMALYNTVRLDGQKVLLKGTRVSYASSSLADFFGLSTEDYRWIVDPDKYKTPDIPASEVIARMRIVIHDTFFVDPETHDFILEIAA